MNESLSKLAEGFAGLIGIVVGWIATSSWVPPVLGFFAFLAALYIAVKIIAWAFRSVRSGVRTLRFRWYRMIRRLEKRAVFRRLKGKFMAKWKNSYMADRLNDAIFDAQMAGIISDQEGRALSKKVGKALGLTDLLPRFPGKTALRNYFLGVTYKDKTGKEQFHPPGYQSLAGPKQKIPGGHPSEDIRQTNVVNSATLARMRQNKAA